MEQHTRPNERITSQTSLKEWIQTHGCFSEEVNLKIFEKWFQRPRRTFLKALRYFSLDTKILCDVGCGYGSNLIHCSSSSYGLEIKQSSVDFATSIGLTVYQRDILSDLSDLPKADVLWCADVLEHVDSPHIFLRKLSQLLRDEGLLMVKIPTIPRFFLPLPGISRYQSGYLADDHINGFTCQTLQFFCERAGFRTILTGGFLSPGWRWLNKLPWLIENFGQAVYIGAKIPDWQYPTRSMRIATDSGQGFIYEQQYEAGKYARLKKCKEDHRE